MSLESLAVRCRGVIKRYGDVTAVDGLDLDVRARRVLRIAGTERRRARQRRSKFSKACSTADAGDVEVPGRSVADRSSRGFVRALAFNCRKPNSPTS